MADASTSRPERVGRALHDELASILQSEVADPRVANVVVARVAMTPDLRMARVYVRTPTETDDKTKKLLLAGLASAAGFLRREVTKRLGLRFAPELNFHLDDGKDARQRVEQLLDEVRIESKK